MLFFVALMFDCSCRSNHAHVFGACAINIPIHAEFIACALDSTISELVSFVTRSIRFELRKRPPDPAPQLSKDAFIELMRPKPFEFPRKGLSTGGPNEKDKLFNRTVDFLDESGDSFSHQEGAVAVRTLNAIVEVLWQLRHHQLALVKGSPALPIEAQLLLNPAQALVDVPQRSHKKKSELSQGLLRHACETCEQVLDVPQVKTKQLRHLRDLVVGILDCVNHHLRSCLEAQARMLAHRSSPIQQVERGSLTSVNAIHDVGSDYRTLDSMVVSNGHYKAIRLNDHLPHSANAGALSAAHLAERSKWMSKLQLSVACELWEFNTGNHVRLRYCWSVPSLLSERSVMKSHQVMKLLEEDVPSYVSVEKVRFFRDVIRTYSGGQRLPALVLNKLIREVSGDLTQPSSQEREMERCLQDALTFEGTRL